MDATNLKRAPVTGAVLCAILIGTFFLATIREGHAWHDDFAMYIYHARNIVTGAGYGDTGYLYNPHLPVIGPRAYPPVFPILLSPLYKLFGHDLWPMKAMIVCFWTADLILVRLLFAELLPAGWLLGGIALLGMNPFFWGMKDNVVSDIPFLSFFVLSLILIERLRRRPPGGALAFAALTGLAMYLAYGTRTIGIVLLPVLVLCDLLEHRRPSRKAVVALGVFAALAMAQYAVVPGGGSSYVDQFHFSPVSLVRNVIEYASHASTLFEDGHSSILRQAVFSVFALLAAFGYANRLRSAGLTSLEAVPWFYGAAVLLWPSRGGMRLLIPLVPFFLFYALAGAHALASLAGARARHAVLAALIASIGLIYTGRYSRQDFGPIRDGVTSTASLELLDYVERSTGPSDVVAFSKPRYLALMTGRRASACHTPPDDEDLWRYLREIHATHFIVGPDVLGPVERHLRRFASAYPVELEPEFENADFTMFRIVNLPF